jgi:WhiB family redox-sensing transcriptional regulator
MVCAADSPLTLRMGNDYFNLSASADQENAPAPGFHVSMGGHDTEPSRKESRKSLEELADELDELAVVPTEVLADWVTAQGQCLWETTFGEPPEWTGEEEPDRELAHRLCAGCPVRAECLEFEIRVAGDQTVGVWGGLNADDRTALHKMWQSRRREELAELPGDEGAGQ